MIPAISNNNNYNVRNKMAVKNNPNFGLCYMNIKPSSTIGELNNIQLKTRDEKNVVSNLISAVKNFTYDGISTEDKDFNFFKKIFVFKSENGETIRIPENKEKLPAVAVFEDNSKTLSFFREDHENNAFLEKINETFMDLVPKEDK